MNKIIVLLEIILVLFSFEKSSATLLNTSEIKLDTFILNNYKNDAKQLYMDEISQNTTHWNYNDPILDTNEINKILNIFQAVYDLNSPERDTVFSIYSIHARYCYDFSTIILWVNGDLPEMQNLVNGIIPTGEDSLDNILIKYHFDSVYILSRRLSILSVYTPDEYNMIPIEKEFGSLSSVTIADYNNGCIGDGNAIRLTRSNDTANIVFSIASGGDCPRGCSYHRYWEFIVYGDSARFVKSYDDTPSLSVLNNQKISNELIVFPNPANEKIKIKSFHRILEIKLYTISGSELITFDNINNSEFEIDLTQYGSGVYLVDITGENFSEKKRISVVH